MRTNEQKFRKLKKRNRSITKRKRTIKTSLQRRSRRLGSIKEDMELKQNIRQRLHIKTTKFTYRK